MLHCAFVSYVCTFDWGLKLKLKLNWIELWPDHSILVFPLHRFTAWPVPLALSVWQEVQHHYSKCNLCFSVSLSDLGGVASSPLQEHCPLWSETWKCPAGFCRLFPPGSMFMCLFVTLGQYLFFKWRCVSILSLSISGSWLCTRTLGNDQNNKIMDTSCLSLKELRNQRWG